MNMSSQLAAKEYAWSIRVLFPQGGLGSATKRRIRTMEHAKSYLEAFSKRPACFNAGCTKQVVEQARVSESLVAKSATGPESTEKAFETFLIRRHRFTVRTAHEYAWSSRALVKKTRPSSFSKRLLRTARSARPYFEEFSKLPKAAKVGKQHRQSRHKGSATQPLESRSHKRKSQEVQQSSPASQEVQKLALKAFRTWLVSRHNFVEGSARDYAWSCRFFFLKQGRADASEKLRTNAASARHWFMMFAACPKFIGMKVTMQQQQAVKRALAQAITGCSATICEKREQADEEANLILSQKRHKVSGADVGKALQAWGYAKNHGRQNVIHTNRGTSWVHSDQLGLVRNRSGDWSIAPATLLYPNFVRLLCQHVQHHNPLEECDFPFLCFSVNTGFAAKIHRDAHNEGPSFVQAFGSFRGGMLRYWPGDDGQVNLKQLKPQASKMFDVKRAPLFMNGGRAHEVTRFQGNRSSIVAYTRQAYDSKGAEALLPNLKRAGFIVPTAASMKDAKAALFKRQYVYR